MKSSRHAHRDSIMVVMEAADTVIVMVVDVVMVVDDMVETDMRDLEIVLVPMVGMVATTTHLLLLGTWLHLRLAARAIPLARTMTMPPNTLSITADRIPMPHMVAMQRKLYTFGPFLAC